jgi:hypothetical protein
MSARGPLADRTIAELALGSAAAKRAYFANPPEPNQITLSWRQRQLLNALPETKSARPEIVRVLCGNRMHRLRLYAAGGPVRLLDHPHLDRKAELALVALGAPRPDCLLVFDAIAGRVSSRRILWRRRAYPIAACAETRRYHRRRGPRPSLEQPLLERYANFVRHRASLWLHSILPNTAHVEVLVVPPPTLHPRPLGSPWSWRQRPGYTRARRGWGVQVHVPFDWCVSVERPFASLLETAFIVDARADRRGQMIQCLPCTVTTVNPYLHRFEWSERTEQLDSAEPIAARRWTRARRSCHIALPDA